MEKEPDGKAFLTAYVGAKADSEVNYNIQQFWGGLCQSNQFAWVGFLQAGDVLDRDHLFIFLLDKGLHKKATEFNHKEIEALETMKNNFVKLSLKLRSLFFLGIYYIDARECSIEEARLRVEEWGEINQDMRDSKLIRDILIFGNE